MSCQIQTHLKWKNGKNSVSRVGVLKLTETLYIWKVGIPSTFIKPHNTHIHNTEYGCYGMKLRQYVQSDLDDSHVGHVYHVLPAYAPAHICLQFATILCLLCLLQLQSVFVRHGAIHCVWDFVFGRVSTGVV